MDNKRSTKKSMSIRLSKASIDNLIIIKNLTELSENTEIIEKSVYLFSLLLRFKDKLNSNEYMELLNIKVKEVEE